MKIEAEVILNLKRDGATCTLLTLDSEVHILLDCGVPASMDFSAYNNSFSKLRKVDMILISHVGSEYVGALPFLLSSRAMSNPGRNIKIYSTAPVLKLGLFNAYNLYLNTLLLSNEPALTTQQSETAFRKFYSSFDKCKQIQFFQKRIVRIKQKDLIISPISIGNSLGACAWIIQDNLINIMYMIQYSHSRDEHLDGINMQRLIKKRIDVLITEETLLPSPLDEETPLPSQTPSPSPRLSSKKSTSLLKETLKAAIHQAVENFSTLIIVSNPSERVIEIVMLLWQIMNEAKKTPDEVFPQLDFFHNYKRYLQDLVNDYIKNMRKETADVLVDYNPLAPESNFINIENVVLAPSVKRAPKIVITTIDCLYFPQMLSFIQNLATSDKNTLLFVGRSNSHSHQFGSKQQWIRHGFTGDIREEPIVISELTNTIFKQLLNPEEPLLLSQPTLLDSLSAIEQIPPVVVTEADASLVAGGGGDGDDPTECATVATNLDTHLEDIDNKPLLDMDKDIFDNETEESLFTYKQRDYQTFTYTVQQKFRRSEYGEELTEEENELLRRISNRKKRKDQPAARSYKTPEQIALTTFKLIEDTRCPLPPPGTTHKSFMPFTFHSIMNIQEFNVLNLSDDKSIANILKLLNPKRIFYVNQGGSAVQETVACEENEIHNQSLSISHFKNEIKLGNKMQGKRFKGTITMTYNEASESKVSLALEQKMTSANPNKEYYGEYPLEKLLEYLQKSGYTFTVAWGGINYLDKVIIKKDNQNFSLQGVRCKEFYEIRKLVYDFLEAS